MLVGGLRYNACLDVLGPQEVFAQFVIYSRW